MKKFLLTLLGVLTMLPAFAQTFEYEYEGKTLRYTVIDAEAKTCSVEKQAGDSGALYGALIIPKTVTYGENDYTVTKIADYGFSDLISGGTVLQLPESIIEIGNHAFPTCRMEVVICPKNVNPAENNITCRRISYIDDEHPAESYQVNNEGKLVFGNYGKELIYDNSIDQSTYVIPAGVEVIKSEAFAYMDIYGDTYYTNLDELTIPASVRVIEADVFTYVRPKRVNFEDWENWYYNITLSNSYSVPYNWSEAQIYAGGVHITTPPALKEGMTEIKDYVNWGLSYRDEIELPSTLKRVGAYAFYNNKELFNVFLNEGLEEIGEYAFAGCELLENQTFPSTLNKIEEGAYKDCTSLTEVVLPESVTDLGKNAFKGCTALEKAAIAIETDTLPDYLFEGCKSLYKVYLPNNLKHIGEFCFGECYSLDEISFPSTLESIGKYAFRNWLNKGNLTRLVIPNSVKSIGCYAFENQSIQYLKIGKGVERIEDFTFTENCLKTIEFSEGLSSIGQGAFSDNGDELGSVNIPSTVTEIGAYAFSNTSICELVIPDNVTSLPSGSCGKPAMLTIGTGIKNIDAAAFGFDNLITFRLKATMPPTLSDAFPLTNDQNDRLTLVVNQGRKDRYTTNARWKQIDNIIEEESTDVTIYLDGTYTMAEEIRMQSGLMPSRVNKLKVVGPLSKDDLRVMSENMVSLRHVDLSEVSNLTSIPAGQFTNSLLTEIIFPETITSIGREAFSNCRLLKLAELPERLEYIGNSAFSNCPGVTISHIGDKVELVGSYAFMNCTGIREMTVESRNGLISTLMADFTVPVAAAGVFAGCSLLERVDFSNTEMEKLGAGVFDNCKELDEILLPETIRKIGCAAFRGTAIRDLSFLPEGLESIGEEIDNGWEDDYRWEKTDGTFSNCRRLVSANIPKNITKVNPNIFKNCPRLLSVSFPTDVTAVGANLVNGDKKLSNISCAAVEAPSAETGAFDNIRLRYVTLTIPTLSFRSYLNAPQWGKFETIMNRITIPVEIDEGIDVSNVNEDDYQDMVQEDELEAAQEEAAQEDDPENAEQLRRRAVRRAAARTNTRSFAALFDGAQINCGKGGSGTRIFINPKEDVKVTSVLFDGVEMIDKMEGNSILIPADSTGKLEIRTDATTSAVESVSSDVDFSAPYDVFDLNGMKVATSLDNLTKGIYVVRQGVKVKKVTK